MGRFLSVRFTFRARDAHSIVDYSAVPVEPQGWGHDPCRSLYSTDVAGCSVEALRTQAQWLRDQSNWLLWAAMMIELDEERRQIEKREGQDDQRSSNGNQA